jgi:hypothetical protein
LDLDAEMLAIAKKRYPKIFFHHGNMINFELKRQFDAAICLFSSIGYAKTKTCMQKAIKAMTHHVLPGGILIVEPWFSAKQWHPGRVFLTYVDEPNLKIVRLGRSGQRGRLSLIDFHYLIGTPQGIEHSVEIHELGLFTHQEYINAFKAAGLAVTHDPEGLDGRGLYIGQKQ